MLGHFNCQHKKRDIAWWNIGLTYLTKTNTNTWTRLPGIQFILLVRPAVGGWNDYMICVCAPHPTFYHSFVPLRITSTRDTENTAATTVYATGILEDSLTSKLYADLALISSCCYTAADNRWPQRGQTNPRRGHAGACGSVVL